MSGISDDVRALLIPIQGQLMRDWSEDHWAAGWMDGLEELVWKATDHDAMTIKHLAEVTGVWISDYFDDFAGETPPTMSLDQWRFEEWPRRQCKNAEIVEMYRRRREERTPDAATSPQEDDHAE